ncbi:thioredoxin family protein [Novipirellula rosea]|uniref:Thiol:disulfide interchange protein n=1 Tax=Novipirellula rosea TaxID=1031540 RepID=A0ABP8MJI4_9BACT
MNHFRKLAVLTLMLVGFMSHRHPIAAAEVRWTHSPEQAIQAAHSTGRLIIVSVGANWCHYCKEMDRDVWKHPAIAKIIAEEYVPLKLTDEQHQELIETMQIKGYPATLIFTQDRQLVTRMDGYISAEKLANTMRAIRLSRQRSPQSSTAR